MNNDLPNDEKLVRYLDGEISGDERNQLELEMQNDPSLRNRLNDLKIAIEAVRQAGTAEKIRSLHGKMMSEASPDEEKSDRPLRKIIRISMGIAASVVLLVAALGIYTYQLSTDKTFDDHFLDYTTSVSRGSRENPSKTEAFFEARQYQQVIDQSKTYAPLAADQLLIALSYLHLDQPSSAIPLLQNLQRMERFKEDADYYLGMAYLKNNEPGKALDELKKIHDNKQHPYHKQVNNGLIRELRLLTWKG
jgi:hypothetical protein